MTKVFISCAPPPPSIKYDASDRCWLVGGI